MEPRTPPQTLKILRLDPRAVLPTRGTSEAAGWDLAALDHADIPPRGHAMIRTGLAVQIPRGMCGMVKPRSSAYRRGLDCDGTIDSDYRGEIYLSLRNLTDEAKSIRAGDRVAQMVLVTHHPEVAIREVLELDPSVRGQAGFGSTGR